MNSTLFYAINKSEWVLRRNPILYPPRHFKMIRYYDFLANRKRERLLPKVYDALDMIHPNVIATTYSEANFHRTDHKDGAV
ncbi:hypothetical protein C4513_18925 [Morganella morganii]|nr:hypothetical protein [Morganella morganii]